jgi:UMF1 family MFS transporter
MVKTRSAFIQAVAFRLDPCPTTYAVPPLHCAVLLRYHHPMFWSTRGYDRRKVVSWALYDCANSAFATTVMAGLFPVFFKQYWGGSLDASVSTFHLGQANSIAAIIGGCFAPFLGYMADKERARKKFLLCFAVAGIIMTGALSLVPSGYWSVALLLYVIATLGFAGGNVFYDSLLVNVAGKEKMDVVSALGYSLGYLGGGVLFAFNVWMTLRPETFGLAGTAEAVRISFLSVAVWWALFSIPLFLFVDEPQTKHGSGKSRGANGWQEFKSILVEIAGKRVVLLFLAGYWLYIDGVNTVIVMAVDYGLSLGFDKSALILALLITQFVGFPAAIAFGKLGEKLGTKTGIFIGLAVYVGVCIWGFYMDREVEFYVLAVAIGLVQGGVQSLSRSFYAKIIPPQSAARFFGFYDMLGKFAAVIGPFLMGLVGVATGNPRIGIVAIIILFVLGAGLLYLAKETATRGNNVSASAT